MNLINSDQWGLAYVDGTTAVLVRRVEKYRDLLDNDELLASGLQVLRKEAGRYAAETRPLLKPPCSPRLVGAAALFLSLGDYEKARRAHELLALGTRGMASAWVGLGYCELQLGQPAEAVRTLEHATRRFPKTAQAWLWLSAAYAAVQREEDAARAFRRAGTLDPGRAARFGNPLVPVKPAATPTHPLLDRER